jgi:hypothetical protein
MQKDQIGVPRFGQGGLRANPVDPCLLLGDFACRFGFGSIANAPFVLLKPCLRNQEPPIKQLADGVGEVDMGLALKQVVNGVWSRQRGSDLVGGSKGGTDIAASVPSHLRMIFEVQQKLFFHLATERLPCRPGISRFPARNPPGDALTGDLEEINATHAKLRHEMTSLFDITTHDLMNFQLLLLSILENKLIWKLTVCS